MINKAWHGICKSIVKDFPENREFVLDFAEIRETDIEMLRERLSILKQEKTQKYME